MNKFKLVFCLSQVRKKEARTTSWALEFSMYIPLPPFFSFFFQVSYRGLKESENNKEKDSNLCSQLDRLPYCNHVKLCALAYDVNI